MDKIKEVMELVNSLIASINEAHHAKSEEWRQGCFQAADKTHNAIESKLRELLSAPVVPQGLLEAAQRAHDWMDSQADSQSKGNFHSFDLLCLRQEREALAATQPPEAEQCQSCRTGSPYACTCTFKTNRNSAPSCFEAEPVQLPEAVAYMHPLGRCTSTDHYYIDTDWLPLYTEQQVRALLAEQAKKAGEA